MLKINVKRCITTAIKLRKKYFDKPVKRLTRGFFITLVAPRFDQFAVSDTWQRLCKQFLSLNFWISSFLEKIVQNFITTRRLEFGKSARIQVEIEGGYVVGDCCKIWKRVLNFCGDFN
ncbi:hypothetical protein CR513_12566, partial [Mucuna pruriens]